MRTKNFCLLVCSVITLTLILIYNQNKPETFQNIVSQTHRQIRNFKDNLRDAERKTLLADSKYLDLLGFVDQPRLFPKDVWQNTSLPVIVTYVLNGEESQAIGLINNVAKVLPNNTILVYNLGLPEYKLKRLIFYCNTSRCQVINFDLTVFPSHVSDGQLRIFRPLVIQDALRHAGAIFFLSNNYRFNKNFTSFLLNELYNQTIQHEGILAWPMDLKNPVSSLTHKKMFEYFHTEADNFLFLQMVTGDVLLIINTKSIHQDIMLLWSQCALTQDCIIPIGAQSVGCNFDKKPQYRYSGCHLYDVSALNVVLGLRFKLDINGYTLSDSIGLFETIPLHLANLILKELEQNATSLELS